MSPSTSRPKTEINNNLINKGLKTNRVSYSIKKTSSSSSSSSPLPPIPPPPSNKPQQQRQPVIIYTHSPKIIKTHPEDFMALVQKLTGLSHDHLKEDENEEKNINGSYSSNLRPQYPPLKQEPVEKIVAAENESSSIITDENNNYGYNCMGEVKSSFATALPSLMMMEPPVMPYMSTLPLFALNLAEFFVFQ
ncbi:hypothetical protein RIF29_34967 [Crotalaria pallida]|uniref:VQ domain-containing protein n=1 Tax=Crotalaria pallida TaxID=3830 RepID=A0AAN9E9G0_CROPI